jgi:hypothetical protein
MSADDQQMLCDTRAYVDLVQSKTGDITMQDIAAYDPIFLTKAEQNMVDEAATKAMARALQPVVEKCRKDPNAAVCHLGERQKEDAGTSPNK